MLNKINHKVNSTEVIRINDLHDSDFRGLRIPHPQRLVLKKFDRCRIHELNQLITATTFHNKDTQAQLR